MKNEFYHYLLSVGGLTWPKQFPASDDLLAAVSEFVGRISDSRPSPEDCKELVAFVLQAIDYEHHCYCMAMNPPAFFTPFAGDDEVCAWLKEQAKAGPNV